MCFTGTGKSEHWLCTRIVLRLLHMRASAQAGAFVVLGTENLVLQRNSPLYTDAEGKR